MALKETYQIERAKWDALAMRNRSTLKPLPASLDFQSLRDHSTLAGIVDFLGNLRGKKVLEYGCGLGTNALLLARSGAKVTTFDLSPLSVVITRARATQNDLDLEVVVAAGEHLPFADESFDVIFGKAILHHLDANLGCSDLHRVLKPGGKAAFAEPMGMNPLLTFARNWLPYRHKTPRGADHPLTYADIERWGRDFRVFHYREIQLLGMVGRVFGFHKRFRLLDYLDALLLKYVPALRRYCRYVVMFMSK